jgi:uncharacterized delta-60 repeat protein
MNIYYLLQTVQITLIATFFGAIAVNAQPGTLDTTFGVQGLARATINGSNHTITAAARQSDGRIVFVGSCTATTGLTSMCIARMNADGSFVESGFSLGSRTWHHNNSSGDAGALAVAIDAQDRIVVAGYCTRAATLSDFCVVRLTPSGGTDLSFGTGGGATVFSMTPGAYNEYATAVAIAPNGNVYVGGQCYRPNGGLAMCVAGFNPDGRLRSNFGNQGIGHYYFADDADPRSDVLNALVLGSEGQLFLGGSCPFPANTPPQFCVIEVSSSGAKIATNIMQASINGIISSSIRAMAWSYDGQLMVSGECFGGFGTGQDFCLARYDPTIFQDNRFLPLDLANTGVKRNSIGYQSLADKPAAMAIQTDGRIVVVGSCALNPSTQRDAFCLQRNLASGDEDRDIASNVDGVGSVVTEFVANSLLNDRALSVFLNHDGSMLAAGTCQGVGGVGYDICLAKYQGGPMPGATRCSPDLDGDGRFNPLIDGLIITRIALGLNTNVVTQGIQFPAPAVRRGWDVIASYLTTQCGVRGLVYS